MIKFSFICLWETPYLVFVIAIMGLFIYFIEVGQNCKVFFGRHCAVLTLKILFLIPNVKQKA
jgi:ABC-type phosphate transport system permease subunit